VWQGRQPRQLPAVPGPLIATRDYAFAPDARFSWWGPHTFVRAMPERIDMLRAQLLPRVAAALVIDQPDGISGHGGGNSSAFARLFGRCLLRFVTAPVAPKECDRDPAS
jgi:hypothetical protein